MKLHWPSPLLLKRAGLPAAVGGCLLLLAPLSTCSPKVPLLQRVETLGVLRVATFNSPTTYYVGPTGPVGFEHDLTRELAESLGLKLEILIAEDESEVLDLVLTGRAHLGAGLSMTPTTEAAASFTPPLRSTALQLVYRCSWCTAPAGPGPGACTSSTRCR